MYGKSSIELFVFPCKKQGQKVINAPRLDWDCFWLNLAHWRWAAVKRRLVFPTSGTLSPVLNHASVPPCVGSSLIYSPQHRWPFIGWGNQSLSTAKLLPLPLFGQVGLLIDEVDLEEKKKLTRQKARWRLTSADGWTLVGQSIRQSCCRKYWTDGRWQGLCRRRI